MLAKLASGAVDEARKILERYLPLASLTAFLCDGACLEKCLRANLDQSVNIPLLEREIIVNGRATRLYPLPPTSKRVALIGAGLSALTAAYELARRGHKVEIFHLSTPGGTLNSLAEDKLPPQALVEAIDLLESLNTDFNQVQSFEPQWFEKLKKEFGAIFLSLDDPDLLPQSLGLNGELIVDPVSMALKDSNDYLFACELTQSYPMSNLISSGKKVAASIDRILQGANLTAARENEAVRESKLRVNLTGRKVIAPIVPSNSGVYTTQEAQAEADRCLNCSCLACVPPCPLLRSRKGFYPKKWTREFYNNIITAFGIRHSNININSCSLCGLCSSLCPNGFNMSEFIDLAKLDMVVTNHMPVSAHEFALEDQLFSNSKPAYFLRPQKGFKSSAALFFPGCQLTASLPKAVRDLYKYLAANFEGGLGLWSACCGAPGRWSGRRKFTDSTISLLRTDWEAAGKPEVVLACPSCRRFFLSEIPFIPIRSLWSLINSLPLPSSAQPFSGELSIHDPCAARLDTEGQEAVRAILSKLGQKIIEPTFTKTTTLCCGYGGLASLANPVIGQQFVLERLQSTTEPIVGWCAVCRDRFKEQQHPALHPLELLFPQLSPKEAMEQKPPTISDRRYNRAAFAKEMLKDIWEEEIEEEKTMNLKIEISDKVMDDMERRRILISDVTAVLEYTEVNGPMFLNPESGRQIACFRPRQVTFWVEYEKKDDLYIVTKAWSHRMILKSAPGPSLDSPATLEGYARSGGRV
jgi:Fe-S oxidoreductase